MSLGKGTTKLEEAGFDCEAKYDSKEGNTQVMELMVKEVKEKCEALRNTETKVKSVLASNKLYMKSVGQNKEVDLAETLGGRGSSVTLQLCLFSFCSKSNIGC